MEYMTLNNGVQMPKAGFGVYQIDPADCARCVRDAIEVGYRSIDTAQNYQNEKEVGDAINSCGIARDQLFLTTKIWVSNAGYEKAIESLRASMERLQTSYVDLVLIHQPFGDYYGTWRALTEAYKAGLVRAIGVSNFYPDRLVDFCKWNEIIPAVNQVETHVYQQQAKAHEIMEKYGIVHESWGPFAEGRKGLFQDPTLQKIADKHGKTLAQVALRFLLQNDIVIIPKSVRKERMAENFDVFSFTLDADDMTAIRALDQKESCFFSHYDPDIVDMIINIP